MKVFRVTAKRIALLLVFVLLNQVAFPTIAFALTSGPSQPESSAFNPVGTSDMVDLFSGDFHYDIPLLDVGGYPINIAYNAGVGMDEEASWVGLGWSLNPGAINRQLRGLPDDFRGDSILKEFNIRPDVTTGINVGGSVELTGIGLGLSASLGIYYNNYRGYGFMNSISPTLAISAFGKSGLTASLGGKFNFDSQNGLSLSSQLGLSQNIGDLSYGLNSSADFDSRRGLRDLSISHNVNVKSILNLDGTLSFGLSTYTPTAELPLKYNSFTFHGSLGTEAYGLNPSVFLDGYKTEQTLIKNRQKQAAFGYLHSQTATQADILDFNRERNGLPWREHMPVLQIGIGTNDLFTASGQGGGGQFRPIRSDVGFFRDALRTNESDSKSLGVEVGLIPNLAKLGININTTDVNANTSAWLNENPMAKTTGYTDWDGRTTFEPVFFKNSGELTMTDPSLFTNLGEAKVAYSDIYNATGAIRTIFQFASNQKPTGSKVLNGNTVLKRAERERRNDVWQYLSAKEAGRHGLEKQIVSYKRGEIRVSKDANSCAFDESLSRTRYKSHHMSEVTVLKPDGARYVYGLPAYNVYQKEVSFSINKDSTDNGTGLVQYATGDNSLRNRQGRDYYYNADIMPAYPYAFLLTAVLSSDYIDRTGNGVSADDYGSAVRINYSKNKSLFKWRTPFGKDSTNVSRIARYQEGRKTDKKGKKASYIYGAKEIWYVHSIESATMVAQFYTSNRKDGLGVINENGGIDTTSLARLQQLDKIELYSKSDLQLNGDNATPVKTVHFQYNYELCPGTPNSDNPGGKGKLTLKRIWFTYGKSGRGELNAYSFNYNKAPESSPTDTYGYNMTNVDRWGSYKVHPTGYPNSNEYPYALQDYSVNTASGVNASIYDFAGAWCLSEITLPSGGVIRVTYEPDDYAFVQNKRAGQMYFIMGFSRTKTSTIDSLLYTGLVDTMVSRYVWIDLEAASLPDNTISDTNAFKSRCLQDIEKIWFNMDVRMAEGSTPFLSDQPRERISGYMEYDRSRPLGTIGLTNGNYSGVGIPVKILTTSNTPIHPVTKAALQTMRLELPDLAYPGAEAESAFEAVVKGMVGQTQAILDLFRGFERNKMLKENAKYVGVTGVDGSGAKSSWIRLCNARFKKYGGGHRVQKIILSDEWDSMATGEPEATYGQLYTYTKQEKVVIGGVENTLQISSGVACWEPSIGGEENLWKEPVSYDENINLAPDNTYYVETPFGESLFPGAMVGYSEIKVQNIGYESNKRNGSGWTVNSYFTARDFPTLVDYSVPIRHKNKYDKLRKFFKLESIDYLSLSQGYVVEVNDMHGKIKEESMYAQNGARISATFYEYKVDNPNAVPLKLNNTVRVATPDGNIEGQRLLGVDLEAWQDFREESVRTEGLGFGLNADAFWLGIIPILIPTQLPMISREDVRFRSAVTTKFIKRTGILTKITKIQDGSTISTENLLWDSETGSVLATKTQNEFEDPIYQFNYPAHWVEQYAGMGMAYTNAGTRISKVFFHNGKPYLNSGGVNLLPDYDEIFAEVDEVAAQRFPSRWKMGDDTIRLTTYKVGTELKFYSDNGELFSSGLRSYDLYMLRTGKRNMASTSIGTLISKKNPLDYSTIQAFTADGAQNSIVNATAGTFADLWQYDCGCDTHIAEDTTINPFRHGIKGNWRPNSSYANHQPRSASKMLASNGITNIRTDGTIVSFAPFWDYISGKWVPNTSGNEWVKTSRVLAYNFKGNAKEEQDALDLYSTAIFGYQGNLNTAVAHNTRDRQGVFEAFEDYDFNINANCQDLSDCDLNDIDRFGNTIYEGGAVSDSISHKGRYSFRRPYGISDLSISLNSSSNTTILNKTDDQTRYELGPAAC